MRFIRYFALLAVVGLFVQTPASQAQVSIGIGVGPAYAYGPPVCSWGYYPYAPYACAPYGYYGPEWFSEGVFVGAGPWYHRTYYGYPSYYRGYREYYVPRYYAYGRPYGYRGGYGHRRYRGYGYYGRR